MKHIIILVVVFICTLSDVQASNKVLDTNAFYIWKQLYNISISNDGSFVSYEISNKKGVRKLILWHKGQSDTIDNGTKLQFSPFSTLCTYDIRKTKPLQKVVMNMETGRKSTIKGAIACGFTKFGNTYYTIRQDTTYAKNQFAITFLNTNGDTVKTFSHLTKYYFFDGQQKLLFIKKEGKSSELSFVETNSFKETDILRDTSINISSAALYPNRDELAYITKGDKGKPVLKVYNLKNNKQLVNIDRYTADTIYDIGKEYLQYTTDGKLIFKITINNKKYIAPKTHGPQIWRWDMNKLPSMPQTNSKISSYFATYNAKEKKIIKLSDDEMPFLQIPEGVNTDITLGFSNLKYEHLEGIEAAQLYDVFLVDIKNGEKHKILDRVSRGIPTISTDKKYLIWFNPDDSSWISMNTKTFEKINITNSIHDKFYNDEAEIPDNISHYGIIGWDNLSHYAYIYSCNDIWKIDASGKEKPECLTSGYGAENNIRLRYIAGGDKKRYLPLQEIKYLSAFGNKTKKSGYYKLDDKNLTKIFYSDDAYSDLTFSKDSSKCIFRKGNFVDYPEIYYSDSYMSNPCKISETNPQQKDYNWATSELVEWKSNNGDTLQGVLCKPQDFDSTKKYPMLIYFYEKKSNELNQYKVPSPIGTVINWPYCASNGYIVFIPDIKFTIGSPGKSAYDAVVSGVCSLIERYPFIDSKNIALNGHSWGGYQTAYIVTQTNIFKAAVAGAPVVNMTSAYGGIRWNSGKSRMFQYEHAQSRIGGTLWDKPIEYIKNSPLFFAPSINTPILILHNKKDGSVMWEQGLEFFMALRRLAKPAWLLNYADEDHKVLNWKNRMDYNQKVMGFYDFYLKGGPKPDWM